MKIAAVAALIFRFIGLMLIAYVLLGIGTVAATLGSLATQAIMALLPLMIVGVGLIVFSKKLGEIIAAGLD